jgi:hypothetical protein
MKRILVSVILLVSAGLAFAQTEVRLTGHLALDFSERPSAREAARAFADSENQLLWGPGWEVVMDHLSLGGTYLVSFFQDETSGWWLDWYGEPLYVGYHLFGAGSFIDPFMQVGLGSAGRVTLDNETAADQDPLYLSIFPFIGGGLALDLDGFIIGGRLSYYPSITPPPTTDFQNYPLDKFQVALFAGVGLGPYKQRRGHGRHSRW